MRFLVVLLAIAGCAGPSATDPTPVVSPTGKADDAARVTLSPESSAALIARLAPQLSDGEALEGQLECVAADYQERDGATSGLMSCTVFRPYTAPATLDIDGTRTLVPELFALAPDRGVFASETYRQIVVGLRIERVNGDLASSVAPPTSRGAFFRCDSVVVGPSLPRVRQLGLALSDDDLALEVRSATLEDGNGGPEIPLGVDLPTTLDASLVAADEGSFDLDANDGQASVRLAPRQSFSDRWRGEITIGALVDHQIECTLWKRY